jgi:uncharacterized protein involved in exopolysaccharide biosynthesis
MADKLAAPLRRRSVAGLLAACMLTVLIGAICLVFLHSSFFEALARLSVSQDTDLPAALALLRSPVLAQKTLAVVGPKQLFPAAAEQERVQLLQDNLAVRSESASRQITITFQHPEQALAVKTVRTLSTLFRQHLDARTSGLPPLALAEQVLRAKRQVVQAETQLAMFSKNMPVAANTYVNEEHSALEERLAEAKAQQKKSAEELAALEQQFTVLPADKEDREAFLQFKFYEQELLRKYAATEPLIGSVRQQLAEIKARLAQHQTVEDLAEQIVAVKAALTVQEERIAGLMRQREQQNKYNTVAKREQARRRLEDGLAAVKTDLAQLLSRLQKSEKTALIITVIEQPLPLLAAVKANKVLALVAAACLALLCILLFLLLRQNHRHAAAAE